MTFQQELASWNPFQSGPKVDRVPELGYPAPSSLQLPFPRSDKKPTVVAFLRHCGCPFAEKTFKLLRSTADNNPSIHFVAVSHSDQDATSNWLKGVGGAGSVQVIVDHERELFSAYGLGLSSFWHALNPWSMASVFQLGRSEQIWNRPTESGSRWQTAGMFGMNGDGYLEYAHVAQAASDLGDVQEALAAVKR